MAGIMLPPMAEGEERRGGRGEGEGRGGGERGRGEEEEGRGGGERGRGGGEREEGEGRGGRGEGEERGDKEHSHEIAGSHLMSNLHFCIVHTLWSGRVPVLWTVSKRERQDEEWRLLSPTACLLTMECVW